MFNINNFLEKINCPSCISVDYHVIRNSNYKNIKNLQDLLFIYKSSADMPILDQLVVCKKCELTYLNPRIKSEIILQSYIENHDEKHISQDLMRYRTFEKSINKIIKKIKVFEIKNKTFLDIGSASGVFLKVIKNKGFDESGFEPSNWMVNFGREKYNVNIKQGFINDAKDIKYDYISFWDVLEHVTDLQATLEKIEKLSKKNTYLIINVPDIGSYAAKLMKFKWPFYLNVHLYYFKKKTLESIFGKYDFELILNFPHWQYLQLGYLFERAGKYFSFFLILKKIFDSIKISKISVPYNMGQTTFVFKKKND
jgi:2-polyprenyl-3-methyl-5-hydroxy-6-metoxy-1,4-benzoquinol methylase